MQSAEAVMGERTAAWRQSDEPARTQRGEGPGKDLSAVICDNEWEVPVQYSVQGCVEWPIAR